MSVAIIYHSDTGNTRHVAQHLASQCTDAHLVEVHDIAKYSIFTQFLIWCKKARSEEKNEIEPHAIDVSGYDLLVLGSPVWAFKPTPVIHAAIDALKACEGKSTVGFFTHGGMPGTWKETFQRWCDGRGMRVRGTTGIHMKDIEDEKKTGELVAAIDAAMHA